jgi:glycosyltransferase involved in cell wall biosynthesis
MKAQNPSNPMTILLIGPLPPPIGGDTRMFSFLRDDLQREAGLAVQVLSTTRGRQDSNILINLGVSLRVLAGVVRHLAHADVISFHASDRGMITFGPLIYLLARLVRKPLIVRLFGGSFDDCYQERGTVGRWLLRRTVLSADSCLFQTKHLVEFFQQISPGHATWFSNYTRLEQVALKKPLGTFQRADCRRFIFLGHVKEAKGIETILDCADQLPEAVSIDIFGPLYGYTAEQIDSRGHGRIHYRGVLTHEQVDEILWRYDALLLPTFYQGEGYPGVIVEALSHEMPVITTRWRSIPEIVNESCGILIEPHNSPQLAQAITRLHCEPKLYRFLCEGAQQQAQHFSDTYWTQKFIQICYASLGQNRAGQERGG